MKKALFTITILLMLILIFFPIISNATGILKQGEEFLEKGEERQDSKFTFGGGKEDEEEKTGFIKDINTNTKDRFEELAGFFWGIGLGAVLITTAIIGIKLMITPAEQKAEVKKSIVPYVVGTVIIFGALTIWQVLIQILDGSL